MSKQRFTLDYVCEGTSFRWDANVLVTYDKTFDHAVEGEAYTVTIALSDRPHFLLVATYQPGCALEAFAGPDDVPEWLDAIITEVEKRLHEIMAQREETVAAHAVVEAQRHGAG